MLISSLSKLIPISNIVVSQSSHSNSSSQVVKREPIFFVLTLDNTLWERNNLALFTALALVIIILFDLAYKKVTIPKKYFNQSNNVLKVLTIDYLF